MDTPSTVLGSEWLSFHLAYHTGNRDRLLTEMVRSTLKTLWQGRRIESFFFLRHTLGGPHIRLRILPSPGHQEEVREEIRKRATSYFAAFPSPARVAGEASRLLGGAARNSPEAEARDSAVLEDNSIAEIPFEPETERYGGAERIGKSIDFFALSSARALRLLEG